MPHTATGCPKYHLCSRSHRPRFSGTQRQAVVPVVCLPQATWQKPFLRSCFAWVPLATSFSKTSLILWLNLFRVCPCLPSLSRCLISRASPFRIWPACLSPSSHCGFFSKHLNVTHLSKTWFASGPLLFPTHLCLIHIFQDIFVNESEAQILSLGADKVVKVWDFRTNRCVQTLSEAGVNSPSITALFQNPQTRALVAGGLALQQWNQKKAKEVLPSQVCTALYNANFRQVSK